MKTDAINLRKFSIDAQFYKSTWNQKLFNEEKKLAKSNNSSTKDISIEEVVNKDQILNIERSNTKNSKNSLEIIDEDSLFEDEDEPNDNLKSKQIKKFRLEKISSNEKEKPYAFDTTALENSRKLSYEMLLDNTHTKNICQTNEKSKRRITYSKLSNVTKAYKNNDDLGFDKELKISKFNSCLHSNEVEGNLRKGSSILSKLADSRKKTVVISSEFEI